jgi:hypothetical protein
MRVSMKVGKEKHRRMLRGLGERLARQERQGRLARQEVLATAQLLVLTAN